MHEFVLSGAPMKRSLDPDARPRQAAARLRLSSADGVLPAARRGGADGGADRDGDEGDARRVRRGDRGDPARGRRGSRDRAQRALHNAGATPGRGRRPQSIRSSASRYERGAGCGAAGACASSRGSSPRDASTWATTSARSRQYVAGQDRGEALYCIVDLHAITVAYDPRELRAQPLRPTAILLAAGLDPERCMLFRQSDVPEHTELTWLLARSPPTATCSGCTSSRTSRLAQRELVSAGLFFYPVLQAADVLAYRANEVPVGEDQRQHIELMRDIAQPLQRPLRRGRGAVVVPEHRIPEVGARIMDLQDPTSKMSTTGGSRGGHGVRARRARRDRARSSSAPSPTPAARSNARRRSRGVAT